jgi:hypothetical protein
MVVKMTCVFVYKIYCMHMGQSPPTIQLGIGVPEMTPEFKSNCSASHDDLQPLICVHFVWSFCIILMSISPQNQFCEEKIQ